MTNVGILGATGYTALELIKILLHHPDVNFTRMTSRGDHGMPIGVCHRALQGRLGLSLVEFDCDDFCKNVDFAFSCLPHAAASPIVRQLLDKGVKVVDFSADYRLNDIETYNQWYKSQHAEPERVGKTAYGLPELFRSDIENSNLVANPGCFPTSSILPLAPLLKNDLISPDDIVIDAKTGISGAGRKPKAHLHFPEVNDTVSAYAIGSHRHAPEIDQILNRFCGSSTEVIFTPHLIPMTRGILSTIYVRPTAGPAQTAIETLQRCLSDFYHDSSFVRITDTTPSTANVTNSNFCDISIHLNRGRIVITSAIDNLVKGASGAAVQNFNLMLGHEETTSLI